MTEKKKMKGITIRLDESIHTEFKLLCVKKGLDLTKVTVGLIEFYLRNDREQNGGK